MMKQNRIFWILAQLLVAAALLAACGSGAAPAAPAAPTAAPAAAGEPTAAQSAAAPTAAQAAAEPTTAAAAAPADSQAKGTLRVATTTDIGAIEVPNAAERNAINAAWTMFDGMLWIDEDGNIQPALAEKYEVSADNLTYTFNLRQGVTFHNGEPFNADSPVFSWKTYSQDGVKYQADWTVADSVAKVDDYTVKVTLKQPNALFLRQVALRWAMIPPKYYEEVGKDGFAQKPVGTGPFVFKEWVKGDHLTVTANPNYWNKGYPKLAEITFKTMPESATRVAAVQAGEIDIATRLTATEAKSVEGAGGVKIVSYPVDRAYYLAFNNISTGKGTPIEDKNVRQALIYAIDRKAIVDKLFDGAATVALGMTAPNTLGFTESDPTPYDPEKAKELLKAAGHGDGFEVGMGCPDGAYSNINEVCQAIAGYLKDIGIKVDLNIQESNAYWDLEGKKQLPPLFVDGWSSTDGEAYWRLKGLLDKDQTYGAWDNPELLKQVDSLLTTLDQNKRAEMYGAIQKQMADDPPLVPLYYVETFEAVGDRVENYKPRAAEDYFLWNVSVKDGQ
jgi:peptide/nickel transport system substrate-binding protein